MNKHKLFCIMGRSASGKSTIAKEVAKQLGLTVVKSYTTRPSRPGETSEDGDHIFITSDQVGQFQSQIVTYTKINGYEYFVTKDILERADIYVIDPAGLSFLQKHGGYEIIPIYIAVDYEIGMQRAIQRGDDLQGWKQRYEAENKQFSEFESMIENGNNCYVVNNNGNIEFAINTVRRYIAETTLENT